MTRRTIPLAALFMAAACAGFFLGTQVCHAQEPNPLARRDRQDAMIHMFVRTRICMRSAGIAAFRRAPESDEVHVRYFMVSVCGAGMRVLLRNDGMSDDAAKTFLVRLSRTAYYEDVLRVPEPPETEN